MDFHVRTLEHRSLLQTFLGWVTERLPEGYDQAVVDIETARRGLRLSSIEEGVAGRDAAWRLYRMAVGFDSKLAAEYFYEVYELVCRSLAFALEGTW